MKPLLCLLLLSTFSLMASAAPPTDMGRSPVRDSSWHETLQGDSGKTYRRTLRLDSPPMIIEDTDGSPHKQAPRRMQVQRITTNGDPIRALRSLSKEFNSASPTRLSDDPPMEDTDKIRMKRGLKKGKGGGSYGGGGCCGSCGGCGGGGGGGGSYSSSSSSSKSQSSAGSYGGK